MSRARGTESRNVDVSRTRDTAECIDYAHTRGTVSMRRTESIEDRYRSMHGIVVEHVHEVNVFGDDEVHIRRYDSEACIRAIHGTCTSIGQMSC